MPSSAVVFDAFALSDYASRGLKQSLEPIEQIKQARRTVNGTLVNVAHEQFRKYKSTIECSDQVPPALDDVFPGDQLVVSCAAELSYVTSGGSANRTVVGGSSRTEGSFTYYRPQLTMLVLSLETQTDEWGAVVSWSMELEEV